jgi:hypothetical protein
MLTVSCGYLQLLICRSTTKRYKLDEDKYKNYSLKRKGAPGSVMSESSPELTGNTKLKQRSDTKLNKSVLPLGQAQSRHPAFFEGNKPKGFPYKWGQVSPQAEDRI